MAAQSSQTLAKRKSDSALMPPPPPPKRQKRPAKVLDEDVYAATLSHIITRDFFPELLETEVQKEYMDALDSNNKDWIRESGRKLARVMTPLPERQRRMSRGNSFTPIRQWSLEETPRRYSGETPVRTPVNADHFVPEEKPQVDRNMSLGAFQAKFTSEDNESFNALLDKQNEKSAAKYAFFRQGNKFPSARQIAYRERHDKLLESGQSTATALIITNAAGEELRTISGIRPSQDLDARAASVDSFPNRQGPRNNFMFGPDGVEGQWITRAQQAEQSSNAPPKAVQYAATRFAPTGALCENAIPHSPSMSAIEAAIAGQSFATESEPGYSGAETPRVNGYAFVDAEPTPSELGVATTDEEAEAAEREAASQLLPKVDESGPNPFTISKRSKREIVHLKLVEKADVSRRKGSRLDQLRDLGITPGRTPTPKFASGAKLRKNISMTPAAQKLADKIKTPRRESDMFASGPSKNASWTPTPQPPRRKVRAADEAEKRRASGHWSQTSKGKSVPSAMSKKTAGILPTIINVLIKCTFNTEDSNGFPVLSKPPRRCS